MCKHTKRQKPQKPESVPEPQNEPDYQDRGFSSRRVKHRFNSLGKLRSFRLCNVAHCCRYFTSLWLPAVVSFHHTGDKDEQNKLIKVGRSADRSRARCLWRLKISPNAVARLLCRWLFSQKGLANRCRLLTSLYGDKYGTPEMLPCALHTDWYYVLCTRTR